MLLILAGFVIGFADKRIDAFIRRAGFKIGDFTWQDPAKVVVLQQCNFAARDGSIKERQMDGNVRVLVHHIKEYRMDGSSDIQLFFALLHQGGFFCFSRLDFTVDILPK